MWEKEPVDEIPYWETVNKYLEKLEPEELQDIVCQLVYRLVCSRAFANARIWNKYWQVIVDGTQIHSSRKKLDEKAFTGSIIRVLTRNIRMGKKRKSRTVKVCADSLLWICENFFIKCRDNGWRYILHYKEGSVPTITDKYRSLKNREKQPETGTGRRFLLA